MNDSLPLYMKLYNELLNAITSLEYRENSQLPSERYLSIKYHVSRTTVRKALGKLAQDGFIYTVHGNASFVRPHVFEQPLSSFYSFTDELKNDNILIHNDLINYQLICLEPPLAQKLGHPAGSVFHQLVRLRSAENYPLMLETTYLPKSRFHQLNIDLLKNKGSLYEYLKRRYDFHIDHAVETFRPIMADKKERDLLQISSSIPCQLLERYSYEENSITEYTYSVIRGDKYIFKVVLKSASSNQTDVI